MKKTILSLIAVAGIAAAARVAPAQSYNPFQIGASGGVALPNGDLGTSTNTGYNIAVVAGYKPQLLPVAVRAEAAYNQFGLQQGGGNINVPSFTGNLAYDLPLGMSFTPYAVGGVGLYRPSATLGGGSTEPENDFGWNVGGGIKIPLSSSFETFIEARYNRVNTSGASLSFVPITVGILF
ncbi:MAG TPA: outer membrane beta-barrel protein [Gemmatimonadaceae bacterium]|nr:outer membrane beta-barrel protein [Gemmatimonadaceae bacterium]